MKTKWMIIALSAMLLCSSCENWLELPLENEKEVDAYWTTESEAEAVLMSCYVSLINSDCIYRMILWGEGRSDDFTEGNSIPNELVKIMQQELSQTMTYTSWGCFYTVINYCNTFIHYAPQVLEKDDNFKLGKLRSMLAEAYTLRALSYFYLVRAFEEVPWVSTPSLDDQQNYEVAQSSERAVLDSIIFDLNHYALPYAPDNFSTPKESKARVTKNAVCALLADIYLWDNQYDQCIEMCNRIVADESLELESGDNFYTNVFYKGFSKESIFELGFDDAVESNKQVNTAVQNLYGYSGIPMGVFGFPPKLYVGKSEYSPFGVKVGSARESEKNKDIRILDFIVESGGTYSIFKYAGSSRLETTNSSGEKVQSYSYRSRTSNWILYRLPDILLMKAEAIVQAKQEEGLSEALSLVNQTYLRSNPTSDSLRISNYTSTGEMASLVLRERQRELMFEGKRWFDLMRLARRAGDPGPLVGYVSRVVTGSAAIGKMSSMKALYWPVNKAELEANPALVQNPFYKTTLTTSTFN